MPPRLAAFFDAKPTCLCPLRPCLYPDIFHPLYNECVNIHGLNRLHECPNLPILLFPNNCHTFNGRTLSLKGWVFRFLPPLAPICYPFPPLLFPSAACRVRPAFCIFSCPNLPPPDLERRDVSSSFVPRGIASFVSGFAAPGPPKLFSQCSRAGHPFSPFTFTPFLLLIDALGAGPSYNP